MYDKLTNTYTCERCGMVGYLSIYTFPGAPSVCTGCANHLRFGDRDPKSYAGWHIVIDGKERKWQRKQWLNRGDLKGGEIPILHE